jgi:two-component system, cell cycle sensor histidine kinase and response regulator CckA
MSAIDNPLRVSVEHKTVRRLALNGALQMQAIGHLASGVAHDLNNLLAVIHCTTGTLRRRLRGNNTVDPELESLELATQAAGGIVRSLLSCHRPSMSRTELIKLNEFIHDAVRLLGLVLPGHISLQAEVEPSPVLWVKADRNQLRQALLNLVVNARDAMPDGGKLRISIGSTANNGRTPKNDVAAEHATFASVTVSDTGIGMNPNPRSRIFEPRFTAKKADQGSGLGLTIVQDIVHAHGGRVEVQSTPGVGTCVIILLPLARPHMIPTMFDDSGPFIAG